MHELHAEGLAVGPLQDRDDLPDGAELEAEHVVEEDRAVPVGLGEIGEVVHLELDRRRGVTDFELRRPKNPPC